MFATALASVRQFTKPVIISIRRFDGTVECGIGAFVLLNDQGWIATAAHLFDASTEKEKHDKDVLEYNAKRAAIESNTKLFPKQKARELANLRPDPKWITDLAYWWAKDSHKIQVCHFLKNADIAVAQLGGFQAADHKVYPKLMNPTGMKPGTSVCRLGYPFHNATAVFDESQKVFQIAASVFPIPEFPNEGIFTRHLLIQTPTGITNLKLIETSSPGLRGQSGGPIFDQYGNLWGIQSRTEHLPLGFSPSVVVGGKNVVEHQFMHVGRGYHVETLIGVLKEKGVPFAQCA
ncbi:MAG: trypsin-like peptidase domain-containing protein [Opitutae bacterium]|nr:trypsin-like peptidase domain-containing protein [Opitutae bacterium]